MSWELLFDNPLLLLLSLKSAMVVINPEIHEKGVAFILLGQAGV